MVKLDNYALLIYMAGWVSLSNEFLPYKDAQHEMSEQANERRVSQETQQLYYK